MNRGMTVLGGVIVIGLLLTTVMARNSAESGTGAPTTRPAERDLPEMKDALDGRDMPRQWKNYTQMHEYFVDGFVNTEGRGLSRMLTPRELARSNTLYVEGVNFLVGNVQLISIPKVDPPFAYDTPADATKKTIKKAICRPLSASEAVALEALRAGKQAILVPDNDHPILVGAVRAADSCLKCHDDAKRGDLLGAFSYPMLPVPVIPRTTIHPASPTDALSSLARPAPVGGCP